MLGGTGLYPPEVEAIVRRLLHANQSSPEDGDALPMVLDLGSGSGIWSVNHSILTSVLSFSALCLLIL